MARSELRANMKFKRLIKRLGLPAPYVMGLLECMWQVGYQSGSDLIGTAEDVELAAEWPGDPGVFFGAIETEWLDHRGDHYHIHDLYEHAPEYVKKKMDRKKTTQTTQNKDLHKETADTERQKPPNVGSTQPTQPTQPRSSAARKAADGPPGFLRFWELYPAGARKVGKAKCLRRWERANLERIAEQVLAGLERWKGSEMWANEDGKYICGPHVWLNDERWDTVPEPAKVNGNGLETRAPTNDDLVRAFGHVPGGADDPNGH